MRVLVTGGGTGGHVAPALAVVAALRERDSSIVFRYVGSAGGIESTLAAEAGIEFVGVASGKLRRSSKGALGLLTLANLSDAFRVPVGVFQAVGAVKTFRPDVVFATGGYVSVPPVVAAALLKIPILTHEQTVTVGLANRINARFAKRIALTFDGARSDLPPGARQKAFVTGNPVRAAIFSGERTSGARRFGFDPSDDSLPCVYVTGGAQGSRIVNNAIIGAIESLTKVTRVLHQCGATDADVVKQSWSSASETARRRWVVTPFVSSDSIGDAWALCDLLVARSGAGTVTEACALGKPAIFIPLVPTGGDEQTRNARRSVDVGGAQIVTQAECAPETLSAAILTLLADPNRRASMGDAAKTLATPNAAADLAEAIIALGR